MMKRTIVAVITMSLLLACPPAAMAQTDESCDVLVYGDSLAGVGAAVAAARQGSRACLLATVGYTGGQATAAGVSTMDEGSRLLRRSGLYAELIAALQSHYGQSELSTAYFAPSTGSDLIGAEPVAIKAILEGWLETAGVRVFDSYGAADVLQDDDRVYGLVDTSGATYRAPVVIDASEWQELYPLVEGLPFVSGADNSCLQDITWTVVLKWYSSDVGVPNDLRIHTNLDYIMRARYGDAEVDSWLREFAQRLGPRGQAVGEFPGWQALDDRPISFELYAEYRGVADLRQFASTAAPAVTRTALNWANDMVWSIDSLNNVLARQQNLMRAQDKTLLLLWYITYELGETQWSLADDQGYEQVRREFNNPFIPERLERYFPPIAYIREGRRLTLALEALSAKHLDNRLRGSDQWSTSVMTGAYFTDTHRCDVGAAEFSSDGDYDVPWGIFVPKTVKGFLAGMPRAGGVDRAAASSLRMQPTELIGGQVAGTIAHLVVTGGHETQNVPVDGLRQALTRQGVVIDVP